MVDEPVDVITLDVYPHGESNYNLYEDDNLTSNYKTGNFAVTKITSSLSDRGLVLKIAKPAGAFKPTAHQYLAKIHWKKGIIPATITENNNQLKDIGSIEKLDKDAGWYYDKKSKVLWVKTVGSNSGDIVISVK